MFKGGHEANDSLGAEPKRLSDEAESRKQHRRRENSEVQTVN